MPLDRALVFPDFSKITAWEVGNEVNGGWLGAGMSAKIDYAVSQVKGDRKTRLSYLLLVWGGRYFKYQSFQLIYSNITPAIKNNLDCVTLSIYTDQQPLGFS